MTRRRNTGGQQFAEGLAGGSGPEEDVEEGYTDAVTRHAKYLGIDPKEDADYMWIAKEVSTTVYEQRSTQAITSLSMSDSSSLCALHRWACCVTALVQ